jgi:hypothetical protein
MNLEHNYDALTSKFPAFARCSRYDFFHYLTEVCVAESAESGNDYRTAILSPSLNVFADSGHWILESSPPPASSTASTSSVPTSCTAAVLEFDTIETPPPVPASAAAASWESLSSSMPAEKYFAEISLEIGIKRASSAQTDFSWYSGNDMPIKRQHIAASPAAAVATAAVATSDDGCIAWFAAAWAAGGAGPGLNAGEEVDMGLYQHWVSIPTLRVDPSDLERFGRSTSF